MAVAGRGTVGRVSKVGVAIANVDHGGHVTADLDALLTPLYVLANDPLPRRPRARRRPRITDAESVCLAVAQVILDVPSERRFLRFAMTRRAHLLPYLPKQPGYNLRMRALAPQISPTDREALERDRVLLAVLPRQDQAARLDPGSLRCLARDREKVGVRRLRGVSLAPLSSWRHAAR